MNKPFLCPCCDKRFTQWMARYNHLQLVHRWENPPLGHKRWVDRKCTKNPSNDEIQRILDDSTELGEKLYQVTQRQIKQGVTF